MGSFAKYLPPLSLKIVFNDRKKAGQILGNNLKRKFRKDRENNSNRVNSLIVVGIPRGGLVVGNEVAKVLNCDLDLINPVRVLAENEEATLGSVLVIDKPPEPYDFDLNDYRSNFLIYLNDSSGEKYFNSKKAEIMKEILLKSAKYDYVTRKSIKGKTVILVDDGVYSGASAIAALRWMRKLKLLPLKLNMKMEF